MSDFEPGFYYATTDRICGVDYIDLPDWRIFPGKDLLKIIPQIRAGQTVLFELQACDKDSWERAVALTEKRKGGHTDH